MLAAVIAVYLLYAFIGLMLVRLIVDYVMIFARSFRPSGVAAALLEIAYSVTDPPLKALRRVLPPIRLGSVSLDLSFLVVFIVASVLLSIAESHS
jgi:YggT family protein